MALSEREISCGDSGKLIHFSLDRFQGRPPRSQHHGIEFFLTAERPQLVCARKRNLILPPRSILPLNAEEEHGIAAGNGTLVALEVSPVFLDELLSEVDVDPASIAFAVEHYPTQPAVPNPVLAEFWLAETTVDALLRFKHSQLGRLTRLAGHGRFPGLVSRAKRVIRDTLSNPRVGLNELARGAGVSKFHFVREFKRQTGVSPARYRNELRIELAKHALATTRNTVLSIATEIGFDDISTFNKAFRRIVGSSPTQYRNIFPDHRSEGE